jgi:Flp pilus assembly protein TadD
VREKHLTGALTSLQRAVELEPDNARFAYVYAVGLDGAGRRADARRIVVKALALRPYDRSLLELRSQLAAPGGP